MTSRWINFFSAFRIRNYRFQFLSDSCASWAFEMEILILGWFILTVTNSPFLLSLFAALTFTGSILTPFFGVWVDRFDCRSLLIGLRVTYAVLAAAIMILAFLDNIQPWQLLIISGVAGVIRPSDWVARNILVSKLVPAENLDNALGFSRTTLDSAKIMGALLGAGLFSALGIGPAYAVVVGVYCISICCSLGIDRQPVEPDGVSKPLTAFKEGIGYLSSEPTLVTFLVLAFAVNLTAIPIGLGFLPVVARDLYGMDENGLAWLVASMGFGAILGAVVVATRLRGFRLTRVVIVGTILWHFLIMFLGMVSNPMLGASVIFCIGISYTIVIVSLSILIINETPPEFRGRIYGIRMLAVFGLPVGLLSGGFVIENYGVEFALSVFGAVGILLTIAIYSRCLHLWNITSSVNQRVR